MGSKRRRLQKRPSSALSSGRCYWIYVLVFIAAMFQLNYSVLRISVGSRDSATLFPLPRQLQQHVNASIPVLVDAESGGRDTRPSMAEEAEEIEAKVAEANIIRSPSHSPTMRPAKALTGALRTPADRKTETQPPTSGLNMSKRDTIIAAARAERAKRRKAKDAARPPCPRHPQVNKSTYQWRQIHFVHIPKAAGTAMGQALRALVCQLNADRGAFEEKRGLNCCLNRSTFCDLGGKCSTPGCSAIVNCELCECWHTPKIKHLGEMPSITMVRNPVERAISGFLFRGHSPNWDRFNVRPEFSKHPGQGRRYTYDEYLDDLFEYHNPITRMIAYDSFPYANITITTKDMNLAKDRLSKFSFVGIQEAFEASVRLLLYKFNTTVPETVWRREVDLQRFAPSWEKRAPRQLASIRKDEERLAAKSRIANFADMAIYTWAVEQFCRDICDANLVDAKSRELCGGATWCR